MTRRPRREEKIAAALLAWVGLLLQLYVLWILVRGGYALMTPPMVVTLAGLLWRSNVETRELRSALEAIEKIVTKT